MRLTQEQISAVQQAVRKYVEKANNVYNRSFAIPVVRFDLRGVRGGEAHLEENVIRVNPVLLVENFEVYLKQTVGHEVAHLITHQMYKDTRRVSPHGSEWQQVMITLGLEPHRCHAYDVSNARARNVVRYDYSCNCKVHSIGIKQHQKISLGITSYHCSKCKGVLKAGTQIGGSADFRAQRVRREPVRKEFFIDPILANRFNYR